MEVEDLKKIGLTDGEIRVYNALLELGETTRTTLAKKSGISPSKIYDVANRLLEKGIISSVKKQGVIHFSAADPERIKEFLESNGVHAGFTTQPASVEDAGRMDKLLQWQEQVCHF